LEALIIFVRNPVRGKVKTRIASEIGDDKALEVYQRLLLHTREITQILPVSKYVYYSDFIPQYDIWTEQRYQQRMQSGDDLGARMHQALVEVVKEHGKVVLIGSDIADLDAQTLHQAFQSLEYVETVIGPAKDGGYYLIGCKGSVPGLFNNMEWSNSMVFQRTLIRLLEYKLNFRMLVRKTDVDTRSDLIELGLL
jgi:rSAM/selenodomain-associated transferase 1